MMAGANAAALVETASSSIFRRGQRCRSAASLVSWWRSRVRMKSASVFALSCHRITTFQSWSAHPRVQIEGFWAGQAFRGHCVGSVSNAITDGSEKFIPADSGQRVLLRVQQHIDEHAILRCQLIRAQVRSDIKAAREACQLPGVRVWRAHGDGNPGMPSCYGEGRTFGGHSTSRLMSNLSQQ